MLRYLNLVNKNPAKIRNVDKEFAKQFCFRSINFLFLKRSMLKCKNKTIFSSMYLVMKMKHHTVFILHNKLLKNMLIYYYDQVLKNPIMF